MERTSKSRHMASSSYQSGEYEPIDDASVLSDDVLETQQREAAAALSNIDTSAASAEDDTSNLISIDHAIELLGFGRFQYMILVASGLCFAADGMQVILLTFLTPLLKEAWGLSNGQAAGLTSTLFAGAMLGTLILGPLADTIGRRPVFLLAATIISLAGLGTALAPNYGTVVAAIFLVGTGVGGLTVPFDILAEFLPAEGRGTNLLKIEYAWTVGVLYVVAVAYVLLQGREPPAWRLLTCLCACPCVVSLVVGWCHVPESPRWLASKGRLDEAMRVLRKAAVANGHADVALIFPDTMALRSEPEEKRATLSDLFQPRWREITLRLWGGWFGFAFAYYGTLLITTRVFSSAAQGDDDKVDHPESFDYSAIFVSSMAEFVGTTVAIVAVDRFGRIPSQVVSYALAGTLLCSLCVLAEYGAPRWTLVALGFCARVCEMAATCITWVSTAEILTTEIRGTGHSAANAMARIGAFFCPFLVEGNTPLIQVGMAMLVVHAFTAFCVAKLPETKGRGLGLVDDDDYDSEDSDLALVSSDDASCLAMLSGELT